MEIPQSEDMNKIQINIIEEKKQNQNDNNLINNIVKTSLSFPVFCSFCKKSPLFSPIFHCKECKIIFCSFCEYQYGPNHPHAYFQIKNTIQYGSFNFGKQNEFDKFIGNVENKVHDAYKSFLNFFGTKQDCNNNDNQNEDNNINNPYNFNNQNRI